MKKTHYKKIIFALSLFGCSFFHSKNQANALSDDFSNKLLIGIDFSTGFSAPSNDDFYIKLTIESEDPASAPGAILPKIISPVNSVKYNYELDSALSGEISFDYILNSGGIMGFGISYGQ